MPDAEKTLTFTLEREIVPVNTVPLTVTGQAKVGETRRRPRTSTGTYIDFVESWQRCDSAGAEPPHDRGHDPTRLPLHARPP